MLIWEILQQLQIQNLQSQQVSGASEAERAAGRTRALSNEVQDRTGRVMLLTEAMWELMADRLGLTVTDLANRVREIQARNARTAIANANAPQTRCSACKAVVPPGMTKCQFCGAEVPGAKADPFHG